MMICRTMKPMVAGKHHRLRGFAGLRSENSNRKCGFQNSEEPPEPGRLGEINL